MQKQVPGCGICGRGGPENLTKPTSLHKEASGAQPGLGRKGKCQLLKALPPHH